MKWIQALLVVALSIAIAGGVAWACLPHAAGTLGMSPAWAVPTIAFGVNWLAFIPAYLKQTERFYDLTGALTYLSVVAFALATAQTIDAVALGLAAMVGVWSARLGTFLFKRVHQDGGDGRFDDIKKSAPRFLVAWTLQGLWVFLTASAALTGITSTTRPGITVAFAAGVAMWATGFGIEVVADRQKRAFKRDVVNKGRFIASGLWAWSRHPNYFGEIVLWTGVLVAASSTFTGAQWAAVVSPLFVTVLLTRVSGVPLLEARADERWGGQPDYEAYKAKTPVLVPRPPRA